MSITDKQRQQVMDGLLRCITDMPPSRGRRSGVGVSVSHRHKWWDADIGVGDVRFTVEAADAAMLYFSAALRLSRPWRRLRAALERACEKLKATREERVEGMYHTTIQLYEPVTNVTGGLAAHVWCGSGLVSSEFRAYGATRVELAQHILQAFDSN